METLNIKQRAIGSGVLFPFKVTLKDGKTGVYPVLRDMDLIENNLRSLMVHPAGFKFRQEEYGSILESYLEEPNTQALRFLIKANISSIFTTYENRITLNNLEFQQYGTWIISRVHFNLKGTPLQAYTDVALNRNL